MNAKYLVIVAAMAVMLIGATALATEDAFADGKKRYSSKSQAVSQVNDCGNGGAHEEPNGVSTMTDTTEGGAENVGCQNTASQIQGDENAAALYSDQWFD